MITPTSPDNTSLTSLDIGELTNWLADHKLSEIVAIDVRSSTPWTDHMIITTAHSQRQLQAIAQRLLRDTSGLSQYRSHSEGLESESTWALIDLGSVVVHIMLPETRSFYELEKLWSATTSHAQTDNATPSDDAGDLPRLDHPES